jgi:hypothetical protein
MGVHSWFLIWVPVHVELQNSNLHQIPDRQATERRSSPDSVTPQILARPEGSETADGPDKD